MCQYQNVTDVRFYYDNVTITWEYTYPSLVCSTVLPLFNCMFTKFVVSLTQFIYFVQTKIQIICIKLHCRGVNCRGVNCRGVNCRGVNCRGVNFRGVNCRGVNCRGVNCRGVNCRGVNCRPPFKKWAQKNQKSPKPQFPIPPCSKPKGVRINRTHIFEA